MSDINDGGPAFPLSTPKWHEQVNEEGYLHCDFTMGMTLRDYFAAKAMQGLIANPEWNAGAFNTAKQAYAFADAMLEARGK